MYQTIVIQLRRKRGDNMEMFILKLIGIICVTALAMSIVISRKNDVDIWAILLATIFELLSFLIIYLPIDKIIELIEKIILKEQI